MAYFEQDLINGSCSLKARKTYEDLDIAPWYGKVRLLPPDNKEYNIYSKITVIQTSYIQHLADAIDGYVNLIDTEYDYPNIESSIDGTVHLNTDKTDIGNKDKPETIDEYYWKTCSIYGMVSLPQRYRQHEIKFNLKVPSELHETDTNTGINCKLELLPELYTKPHDGVDGHVFVQYDKSYEDIDGTVTIKKETSSTDIDSAVTFEQQPIISDPINGTVTLMNYYHSVDLNCVMKVPCYRGIFTIPMEVTVVPHMCYDIYSKVRVVNKGYRNIDCVVRLAKNKFISDDGIDGRVSTNPCSYKMLPCRVNLFKVITRRDMDGSVNLIGRRINDIDSSITIIPPIKDPEEYNKDISCTVQYGYKDKSDLYGSMKVNPQIFYNKDIDMSLTLRERARIGIVVDPRWHYDVFTFKSSILTLFDKYFQKLDLDIVYGGNPRSDWDIEHLGYVYKYHLEKVPIMNNFWKPGESRESVFHFMTHLFSRPVNKVFLFMDKPTMVRGTYLSPLADFCYRHDIPLTIITSGGEWFQFSENIKHDYDYQEVDNINHTNMIHVQHHEHQWMKPNDGNFDGPPPRIVY